MQSKASTVSEYLASLPEDRRKALNALREVINANLDQGFQEGMQYGMIGYFVPHGIYPDGYHCDPKQPLPFAGIASQKNHMSLYLMCVYGSEEHESWFREQWAKSGKKLDMGKACVRFKKIEDVPLDVIGKTFKRVTLKKYLRHYEDAIESSNKRASAKRKAKSKAADEIPAKKASAKKKVVKKPSTKKVPAKKKAPAKNSAARRI